MNGRMLWAMGMTVGLALGAWAEGQPMGKDEAQIIKSRMIPYPGRWRSPTVP